MRTFYKMNGFGFVFIGLIVGEQEPFGFSLTGLKKKLSRLPNEKESSCGYR
jgi:hypothetical protein